VAPTSLAARFLGIITAPTETYRAVVAHPRWFGMLALVVLIGAAGSAALLSTERGREAMLDAQVSQMEAFGMEVDDAAYERLRQGARFAPYTAGLGVLFSVPLFFLIVAGILFAVFNAALGGDATFRQQFAVVVHAAPIGVLHQLFTIPVNYAKGTMGSVTNLAVLLPMLDETSFLARLLGAIDIFYIWQLVVLSIGLAVLYRRRTQPIATTLIGIYLAIAGVVALVMSRLGGA
jgi:hypothetical protein